MKNNKMTVFSALMALGLALTVSVQGAEGFGVTGVQPVATNYATAVIPVGDGAPVVTYLRVTGDDASCTLYLNKKGTNQIKTVLGVHAGTTNLYGSFLGIAAGSPVVIRDVSATPNVYFGTMAHAVGTSSNIILRGVVPFTPASGDLVYGFTANGSIAVGAAAKELNMAPGGLWFDADWPAMFSATNAPGTNVTIDVISGYYSK